MIECINDINETDIESLSLDLSMGCGLQRNIAESVVLCIIYLVLTILSFVSNGCVILLAIWERCRELDSLTFVFVSSLSFNQLFISFFIYPLISYSVIARVWDLQNLWCWFCALVSSYLYTVYTLHIVVLVLDMIVVKFCNVRTLISVSVSKTIALTTWIISFAPQLYPLMSEDRDKQFRYDPVEAGCFQTFLFSSVQKLVLCIGIYVLLPLIVIAVRYMQLLFNEDDRRNLAATISRRLFDQPTVGVRNYQTSLCLGFMAALTTLPWFTFRVVKMAKGFAGDDYSHRVISELGELWLSLASLLVPAIYLATCPTYFRRVFPEERFRFLYKLGLGRERKKNSVLPNIGRDLLQNAINPIQEEEEEVVEEDSEDYIELPAVTITLASRKNKTNYNLNVSLIDSDDGSGMTYENGHATTVSGERKTPGPSPRARARASLGPIKLSPS